MCDYSYVLYFLFSDVVFTGLRVWQPVTHSHMRFQQ